MSSSRRRRRDRDPVKVGADGRVWYWTGGAPGVGVRKGERHEPGAAAEARATELRHMLAVRPGATPHGDATLDDMVQAALDEMRATGGAEGSIRQFKSDWNTWVPEEVGSVPARQASLLHLNTVFVGMVTGGASPSRVQAVARTINTVTAWGVRNGYFGVAEPWGPPAQRAAIVATAVDRALKRLGAKGAGEAPISIDECPAWSDVLAYADALEQLWPGYGRHFVLLSAGTGVRILEAAAWRVQDLADAERVQVTWQLDRYGSWPALRPPKGGKARTTILWGHLDDVRKAALDAADGDGWLWQRWSADRGRPFEFKRWADELGRLCARARADAGWDARWPSHHWTRHHWATWSMAAPSMGGYGLGLTEVSRWLGHADPGVTQNTYSQPVPDAAALAVQLTGRPPGARSKRAETGASTGG